MPFFGEISANLHNRANQFLRRSWSFIPLCGDTDLARSKAPALVRWTEYQRRLPVHDEIVGWFGAGPGDNNSHVRNGISSAIGIVLGPVSGLAVLDIDDPVRAVEFALSLPHLTDTLTIISGNRRLPHYYFRVPSDLVVKACSQNGVELRSDGQYVVAPGSVIGGRRWKVVHDVQPRTITSGDLSAILRFLRPNTHEDRIKCEKPSSGAILSQSGLPEHSVRGGISLDAVKMVRRYRRLAVQMGRNNALFSVACLARDQGWSIDRTQRALGHVHTAQLSPPGHAQETPSQRLREATATIESAYSRPPRSRKGRLQLPNSVREKLLELGLVNLARLLDGLLLVGVEPGEVITPAGIYERLAEFGIGRNVVYKTLKTLLPSGDPVFCSISSPRNPPSPDANAARRCAGLTNQCLVDRVAEPGKKRGRPILRYEMPAVERLCELLGVPDLGGDRLAADDLRSPAAYRAALHTAMIRRAPGQYSRRWLAQRLGASPDSCRRYERERGVDVQPVFKTWQIDQSNAEGVLPDRPEPGCFLEDDRGKRYPSLVVIARMLLAHGRKVVFRWQRANHYSTRPAMADGAVPAPVRQADLRAPWAGQSRRSEIVGPSGFSLDDGGAGASGQMLRATTISPIAVPERCCGPQQLRHRNKRRKTDAVKPDPQEITALADRVYCQIRALNPARSLTRSSARSLVRRYGAKLVERGLMVIASRRNVRNPAGFLLHWLRSEAKVAGGNSEPAGMSKNASEQRNERPHSQTAQRTARTDSSAGKSRELPRSADPRAPRSSPLEAGLDALDAYHTAWLNRLRRSQYSALYAAALDGG